MAAPLLLEVGKVPIIGAGRDRLAEEDAADLMTEAAPAAALGPALRERLRARGAFTEEPA